MSPSCASHPPPHTQCANNGYVQSGKKRGRGADRSQPPAIGARAERNQPRQSTLNIPSNAASDAGRAIEVDSAKKNGPGAIQFHPLPPSENSYAGPPAYPCQAKPHKNRRARRPKLRTARTSSCARCFATGQAGIDQRKAGDRQRNQKNRQHAKRALRISDNAGERVTLLHLAKADGSGRRAPGR